MIPQLLGVSRLNTAFLLRSCGKRMEGAKYLSSSLFPSCRQSQLQMEMDRGKFSRVPPLEDPVTKKNISSSLFSPPFVDQQERKNFHFGKSALLGIGLTLAFSGIMSSCSASGSEPVDEPRIDLGWGALDQNLKSQGRSAEEISKIKEDFSKDFLDFDKPVTDEMREIYKMVIPTDSKERIEAIKADLDSEVKDLFNRIWKSKESEFTYLANEFEDLDFKIKVKLRWISALGEPGLIPKAGLPLIRDGFVDHVLNETKRRFNRGEPASFEMMALMLCRPKLGNTSITNEYPMKDPQHLIKTLQRLADLGVKEAISELIGIYESKGVFWPTRLPKDMLTPQNMIEGLLRFAKAGELRAINELRFILSFYDLPYETKMNLFVKLMECDEVTATKFYAYKMFSDLTVSRPLQERVEILESRAKSGMISSIKALLDAYLINGFRRSDYMDIEPLNLSQEERWRRILALRENDPKTWTQIMERPFLHIETYSEDPLIIPLSMQERYQWILDKGMEDPTLYATPAFLLAVMIRPEDKVKGYSTSDERLEALYRLAMGGSIQAVEHLTSLLISSSEALKVGISLPNKEKRIEILKTLAFRGYYCAQQKVKEMFFPRLEEDEADNLYLNPEEHPDLLKQITWAFGSAEGFYLLYKFTSHIYDQKVLLEKLARLHDTLKSGELK